MPGHVMIELSSTVRLYAAAADGVNDFHHYCDEHIGIGVSAKQPFRYDAAVHRGIIKPQRSRRRVR
jgi:hypothetical protein